MSRAVRSDLASAETDCHALPPVSMLAVHTVERRRSTEPDCWKGASPLSITKSVMPIDQ